MPARPFSRPPRTALRQGVIFETRRHVAGRLRYFAMDVLRGFNPMLILVLNLAGTFVFGLSGGLRRFPPTENDPTSTAWVRAAFEAAFGDRAQDLPLQTASGDFSDIPNALSVPYTYWGIGRTDPDTYQRAAEAGRILDDIPVNHSPTFAPVVQPTLDTGTPAMVSAALAWLA